MPCLIYSTKAFFDPQRRTRNTFRRFCQNQFCQKRFCPLVLSDRGGGYRQVSNSQRIWINFTIFYGNAGGKIPAWSYNKQFVKLSILYSALFFSVFTLRLASCLTCATYYSIILQLLHYCTDIPIISSLQLRANYYTCLLNIEIILQWRMKCLSSVFQKC